MKNTIIGLIICAMLLCLIAGLCACGNSIDADSGNKVVFKIKNTVPDRITLLSVCWAAAENVFSSNAVELAGGGFLECRDFIFELLREDVENEEWLKDLHVTVRLSEGGNSMTTVAEYVLPSAFGDSYEFELSYADGSYQLSSAGK